MGDNNLLIINSIFINLSNIHIDTIDNDLPSINGLWYVVVPKCALFRVFTLFNRNVFRNKNEAINCAKLRTIGKWDYIKSSKIIYGGKAWILKK